jgi:hypothetical protein
LGKDFQQHLQSVEQWFEQTRTILDEQNDNDAYLIDKHRQYFQLNDKQVILDDMLTSGQVLLDHRIQFDRQDVQCLMDTCQMRWRTLCTDAGRRLIRLEYTQLNKSIVEDFRQFENVLDNELKALVERHDSIDLIRRHNEYFHVNHSLSNMNKRMSQLKAFANEIDQNDSTSTREHVEQLDQTWTRIQTNINDIEQKLDTIPKQWQEFDDKFVIVFLSTNDMSIFIYILV